MRRLGVLTVAAALVLAVVGGHFALRAYHRARDCDQVRAGLAAQDRFNVEHADDEGQTVAFLGDSFTTGRGASSVDKAWAPLLARARGWRPVLVGFGGTGLAADGVCGDDRYASRVGEVVQADADLVVVQASTNDAARERPEVAAGLDDLLLRLPGDVPVVVVTPTAPSAGFDRFAVDAERLAREVAGDRAQVASGADAFPADQRDRLITADGVHPNDEGHAAFADVVDDQLGDGYE